MMLDPINSFDDKHTTSFLSFRKDSSYTINFSFNRTRYDCIVPDGVERVIVTNYNGDERVAELAVTKEVDGFFHLCRFIQSHPNVTEMEFRACSKIENIQLIVMAIISKRVRPTLKFDRCRIGNYEAKAVGLLLDHREIKDLQFIHCVFAEHSESILSSRLRDVHLQRFGLVHVAKKPATVLMARLVPKPLDCMHSVWNMHLLTTLSLSLPEPWHWDLLRHTKGLASMTRLQHFTLSSTTIHLESMNLVLWTLQLPSLVKLELSSCPIDRGALQFLVASLADGDHHHLDSLVLDNILPWFRLSQVALGRMKVKHLEIRETKFLWKSFSRIAKEITSTGFIQSLGLVNTLDRPQMWEQVFDILVRGNAMGPSKLTICEKKATETIYRRIGADKVRLLMQALEQSTTIRELTIEGVLTETDIVTLAKGLASQRGLRKLTIVDGYYCDQFVKALDEILMQNTTLSALCLNGDWNRDGVRDYLSRIRYRLAINRVGNYNLLHSATVPLGIWARVLEKSNDEIDGLYFVLTGMPQIVRSS